MTEWMFQDVCDVEEWYVCSSSSHQARCDVALDMGHSRPAGHKWAQGSPHDDKWVWTGCYAGAVPAGRAGRCAADLRGPRFFWRGRQAYTASASGGAARVQDPFGIPSGLATLSVYSTSDRLHSNEKGRRRCSVGLRATPVPGERAGEQGPHSVRRLTRADSTVRLPIRTVQ
jgi:hypothetical protein